MNQAGGESGALRKRARHRAEGPSGDSPLRTVVVRRLPTEREARWAPSAFNFLFSSFCSVIILPSYLTTWLLGCLGRLCIVVVLVLAFISSDFFSMWSFGVLFVLCYEPIEVVFLGHLFLNI